VQIDGNPAKVFPAYTVFMAVPVEVGEHKISITYRPFGFYFGGLFSILGLLCFMFVFYGRYKGSKGT
jgi:uncharacterized membrane protein YfhO